MYVIAECLEFLLLCGLLCLSSADVSISKLHRLEFAFGTTKKNYSSSSRDVDG
jgi:hypothetical protein